MWRGAFCQIDDAIVSNLILTIRPTALCDKFGTSAINTVVHWHE